MCLCQNKPGGYCCHLIHIHVYIIEELYTEIYIGRESGTEKKKQKADNKKKIQDVINAQENKDINRSDIYDIKNANLKGKWLHFPDSCTPEIKYA